MNKKNYICALTAIIFLSVGLMFNTTKTSYADYNRQTAEIVMELTTNRVLYESNAHEKCYMASTTKILTAITVIENFDLNATVIVPAQCVGVEGSSIYLEQGEKLTVKELLYGLMLRSGNDCAETLAVFFCGNIESFATLMNSTAKKIGANNSNFINPHGLHDDNHYTTAFDLGLISCYAMKNNEFREIVGTKSVEIPWTTRTYNRFLVNKNKMLNEFDGATGIKTGFTKKAGRCLVSSCLRNGIELICVVLNCPSMFQTSKNLLSNYSEQYSMEKIFESDHIVDFVSVEGLTEKCGLYIKRDVVLPLSENEKNNLEIVFDYPRIIDFTFKTDQEIGSIKFYLQNKLLFSEKIYTIIGNDN